MSLIGEDDRVEYASLTSWARDAERTAQLCWVASMVASVTLLGWAAVAQNPALLIPVVITIATGYYATMRSRQQSRLISTYIEECVERQGAPRWFTHIARVRSMPGLSPLRDWIVVCLANGVLALAVLFGWLYASSAANGEIMASIVTGCGIFFGFHTISEATRFPQSDVTALWQQNDTSTRIRVRAIGE
jgi:hypothetical protein